MHTHLSHDEITIRTLTEADGPALARLAQRDSAPTPAGRVVGAFSDGALLAAQSLRSGAVVADPFRRTDELRPLLARRAGQLGCSRRRGRRRGPLSRVYSSSPTSRVAT